MSITVPGMQLYGTSHASGVATRRAITLAVGVGQSNWLGTDSTGGAYNSVLLSTAHAGITPRYFEQGAELTTYGATAGLGPHLIEQMRAEGSTPIVLNWAQGSVSEVNIRTDQIPGLYADLVTVGKTAGDVDLVWIVHGESERLTLAEAEEYRDNGLERVCQILEASFPNALIAINILATESVQYLTVRQAQTTVCARRANRIAVDCTDFTASGRMVDNFLHYTDGPLGTEPDFSDYPGQQEAARRLWAALPAL